jgi:hypothetical protein
MKSRNITVKHFNAFFLISKKDRGLVYIICKNRDIQELNVSDKHASTRSLSIPSAHDTVLKQ